MKHECISNFLIRHDMSISQLAKLSGWSYITLKNFIDYKCVGMKQDHCRLYYAMKRFDPTIKREDVLSDTIVRDIRDNFKSTTQARLRRQWERKEQQKENKPEPELCAPPPPKIEAAPPPIPKEYILGDPNRKDIYERPLSEYTLNALYQSMKVPKTPNLDRYDEVADDLGDFNLIQTLIEGY